MKTKILLLALVVAAIPWASVRADLIDNLTIGIRRTPPPPAVVVVPDDDRRGPDQWEHRDNSRDRTKK